MCCFILLTLRKARICLWGSLLNIGDNSTFNYAAGLEEVVLFKSICRKVDVIYIMYWHSSTILNNSEYKESYEGFC